MRRFFSLIIALSILIVGVVAEAATVTDARWGVKAEKVLRLVLAVDTPVKYNVRLEGNTLKILTDADLGSKAKGTWDVKSDLASSMTVKKEKGETVLSAALKQSITTDNYKTFVLRNPYRIIVDISSNKASASKPVVSNKPVNKNANSGDSWTTKTTTTSSGSWTDRFKKSGTSNTTKLTPSERVKQSIAAAKAQQQGTTTTATTTTQKSDNTSTAVAQAKADTQGSLKKILTAKQAARKEAAAEAAAKKKTAKKKTTTAATTTEVVNKSTVDGVVVIKGTGKYKTSGGLKDKVITLDAGHGGTDSGAIGQGGTQEKNLTLPITKKVADLLTKAGAKVHMTRTTDVDVHGPYATDKQELQARVNVAEKFSSDLFVSVHINSSVNSSVKGVSCYYYPKTSNDARIARCIHNRLLALTGMNDLYIREAGFYVIKRNSMPATLLELGFISNRSEENTMRTAAYQEKAAQAIYEGIKNYFAG